MKKLQLALLFPAIIAALAPPPASSGGKGDGFVPMFNGKDLTGWVNVNCAPETFFVKDNMIITTGKPTGYLRTERQYENFIAEFDWMHLPDKAGAVGNSGFFVWADPIPAVGTPYTRGIEVQVLVNLEYRDKTTNAITATSHGDLFSIWGAKCVPDRAHPLGWERCLPSENHCKGANEWNHYRVVARDGVIKLEVNGKEVSGVSKCSPRKGYLALESEGSECRFKNLKIKELPTSNPKADEIADVAQGHKQLFTGLDLRGWKASDDHKAHWKPADWRLVYDGQGKADLWTEKEYGDFELVVDWRLPAKANKKDSDHASGILLRGTSKFSVVIGANPDIGGGIMIEGKSRPVFGPQGLLRPPGQWNRSLIRIKGDRVTIYLKGLKVEDNVQLPGIAARGPIGLQHLGQPVEFGNLFIRELAKGE